jgi:hypothetical protein
MLMLGLFICLVLGIVIGISVFLGLKYSKSSSGEKNKNMYLSSNILRPESTGLVNSALNNIENGIVRNTRLCVDFSYENLEKYSIKIPNSVLIHALALFEINRTCSMKINSNVENSQKTLEILNNCNKNILLDIDGNALQLILDKTKVNEYKINNIIVYFVISEEPTDNTKIILIIQIFNYLNFIKSGIINNTIEYQTIIAGDESSLKYLNDMCNN